jgi:hypothetical protein
MAYVTKVCNEVSQIQVVDNDWNRQVLIVRTEYVQTGKTRRINVSYETSDKRPVQQIDAGQFQDADGKLLYKVVG